ncbi:hypothetical protein Tco_0414336 [Tanacetum coccineum]
MSSSDDFIQNSASQKQTLLVPLALNLRLAQNSSSCKANEGETLVVDELVLALQVKDNQFSEPQHLGSNEECFPSFPECVVARSFVFREGRNGLSKSFPYPFRISI